MLKIGYKMLQKDKQYESRCLFKREQTKPEDSLILCVYTTFSFGEKNEKPTLTHFFFLLFIAAECLHVLKDGCGQYYLAECCCCYNIIQMFCCFLMLCMTCVLS